MNIKISSWIEGFSFFKFIGLITFGVIISNYFLDKPLINIRRFLTYCLIGLFSLLYSFILITRSSEQSNKLKMIEENKWILLYGGIGWGIFFTFTIYIIREIQDKPMTFD